MTASALRPPQVAAHRRDGNRGNARILDTTLTGNGGSAAYISGTRPLGEHQP